MIGERDIGHATPRAGARWIEHVQYLRGLVEEIVYESMSDSKAHRLEEIACDIEEHLVARMEQGKQ